VSVSQHKPANETSSIAADFVNLPTTARRKMRRTKAGRLCQLNDSGEPVPSERAVDIAI
jgi:hypothetical protein